MCDDICEFVIVLNNHFFQCDNIYHFFSILICESMIDVFNLTFEHCVKNSIIKLKMFDKFVILISQQMNEIFEKIDFF